MPPAIDPAAERHYRQAIAVAERQSAKLFQLRASTSLARLWRDQGKRAEARDLLGPIYNWFTEGFDAPDLKDAKALLERAHVMSDVRTWLAGIGLGQYADAFEANDVEMDLLKDVDDQMLKDIGVTSAGHRLRIRNAIAKLAPTSDVKANANSAVAALEVAAAVRRTPPAHRDVLRPGGFDGAE